MRVRVDWQMVAFVLVAPGVFVALMLSPLAALLTAIFPPDRALEPVLALLKGGAALGVVMVVGMALGSLLMLPGDLRRARSETPSTREPEQAPAPDLTIQASRPAEPSRQPPRLPARSTSNRPQVAAAKFLPRSSGG